MVVIIVLAVIFLAIWLILGDKLKVICMELRFDRAIIWKNNISKYADTNCTREEFLLEKENVCRELNELEKRYRKMYIHFSKKGKKYEIATKSCAERIKNVQVAIEDLEQLLETFKIYVDCSVY